MTHGETILVVDDDPLARRKLVLSAKALDHAVEDVESADAALERLQNAGIEIVLLDIEMPGKNGYAVLDALRSYPLDRRPPVIVVSSLDDPEAIAQAIELGAVDFLPKAFNAVILKARINACLRESRRREEDRRTLQEIERLTQAAGALDSDDLNPMDLAVGDLAARDSPLSVLARVLLNKSIMVYNRRQSQAQQIRTLNGILLLLFIGACFGLKPAIAKLGLAEAANPIAIACYTMGLSTIFTTLYAVSRKARMPRVSTSSIGFFLVLALLTFIPQVLLFWVAAAVPGVLIAILISLESFMVFFVAAAIRLEPMSLRRFFGLFLGVAGVAVLLVPFYSVENSPLSLHWLLITMIIPACFAGETVLLSLSKSIDADLIAVVALIFGLSTVVLFGVAALTGGFVPLQAVPGRLELSLIAFSVADSVAMISLAKLIDYAGPVFSGQKAYTVATGGVIWSILLLNEVVAPTSLIALSLILMGLYFVARKAAVQKLIQPPTEVLAGSPSLTGTSAG
jgi:CheY-like chemotaxis protein